MGKKLYRITDGRMICGVCGGVAEYFDLDPTLIRLGWVIISCFAGAGVIAYIAAAFIMPEKPRQIESE